MMKNILSIILSLVFLISCNTPSDKESIIDTLIIGGGLMGSSTAWHLSNQGNEVLLLEKQDSIYTQGSSYGEARIARSSNRGSDIWSYLHNKSVEETHHLINFLNSKNTSTTYRIEDIYTTSPVTYVGRTTIYDKLYNSLIRQKVEYEMATTPEEGKAKFDVTLPDSVLIQREFNKHSGTINPHQLITYLQEAVRRKGNKIQYHTKVTNISFNEKKDRYELKTESVDSEKSETLFAKKIVAAAGPYNGSLLKEVAPYFDSLITPQRVFLAFLKIKKAIYEKLTKAEKEKLHSFYPVINSSKGTRKGSFFSMIEYQDKNGIPIIKIGGHFQRSTIENLDNIWKKELAPSEIEWSLANTAQYFKLLNLPIEQADIAVVDGYSCVYSLTKTEVPFVTPIVGQNNAPNHQFVVLGGMSGVGAKGAMTYGLIAANTLHQNNVKDSLYQIVRKELGFDRLLSERE